MLEAARVGDDIGHSHALAGMIAGTVVGGLLCAMGGIAAGALMVAGLASSYLGVGLLLVGASLAVGYATGELATAARDGIAAAGAAGMSANGKILTGSHNVFINGKPAAIATLSQAGCANDGPSMQVAQGSASVFINGFPAARIGDATNCDAKVLTGSSNVFIGGARQTTLPITPEVADWMYKASDLTLLFTGLVGGWGGAAGKVGALSKLLAKLPGINKLARITCRAGALMTGAAAAGIIARPVDLISGQKFLDGDDELDFTLPSRLPVLWQRYWRSGNPAESVLGRGWSLFWETRLARYQDGLVWRAPSGDYVSFPDVPKGRKTWCDSEKCWLEHHSDDSWSVFDVSGERLHYGSLDEAMPGLLTAMADLTGNTITFHYQHDGLLHELIDSAGQRVICRYDPARKRLLEARLDDAVTLVSYEYDDEGQLVRVKNRGGSVVRRFSWHDGLMSSHEDANGLLNEYLWREIAGLPRVVAYRNSAGERLDFSYDFENGTRRAVREDGCTAHWVCEDDDSVAAFTDWDGRRYSFIYQKGELCCVLLPGGAQRSCQWDRHGRLLSEKDELGRRTEYRWSRLSTNLVEIAWPDGVRERSDFDPAGRLIAETDAAGNITRWHYPDAEESLPDRITDASGGEVSLQWNHQGLLTQRTDCSGSITRWQYDSFGQPKAMIDAQGNITRWHWLAVGQLSEVEHPDGTTERFSWNERNQLAAWHDPLESLTRWQYNALGQPLSQTDRLNRTRRWHYDVRGRLTELDNGNGGRYRFEHDPTGRLTREVRPDETSRQFDYDEAGYLATVAETAREAADGGIARRSQMFRHDAAGQLLWRANISAEWDYCYDLRGRLTRLQRTPTESGRALGIEEDSLQFSYNALGQLEEESGVNGTLRYTRDAQGNLTHLALPGDDELRWLHYGSGHVSAIGFNRQTVSEFTRDSLHREVSRTQGTRLQTRSYDALGRRTQQQSQLSGEFVSPQSTLLARAFRYTARGELAGVSDTLRGDIHYGYDAEGRLLSHAESRSRRAANELRYDNADNLLAEGNGPLPDNWGGWNDDPVYGQRQSHGSQDTDAIADNRLSVWRNLFYKYDGWGNLISRRNGADEQHYRYDADNRLIKASGTGPEGRFEAHYHYDALGRRTCKAVRLHDKTVATRFLWQGYRLLQEQKQNGARQTYLYDPNDIWSPLARLDQPVAGTAADIFWFNTDLNGAPLEVTDEEGHLRWAGHYGTFGEVKYQTTRSFDVRQDRSLTEQPLRYAGQYADKETGLHYNLFRYYDPGVGRFTVQDPIGLAGGDNLYAYAPNPLSWIDPLGLTKCNSQFNSRKEAFRAAKRDAGIPMTQQPDRIFNPKTGFHGDHRNVRMTDSNNNPISDKSGNQIWTREYQFTKTDGNKIIIQDHSAGHSYPGGIGNQGRHLNVRPIENIRTGFVSGTFDHYEF
ncbi:RHS/YD repeat-containing protein [Erwinia billingiae Eb661]|uniref:RHS/YD repeat-containing protein n=1 Tax=Erwinia billingiae (strain Eb661) TaxID=634500 RepID=D8MWY1_ERWBE|nr:HNH/endonuclease VII fold putative polymorphic toxin [Erwinia billingiae]CAX61338.1 RHS/YD repeat-containing protein [Erwinia billingiae Eb661]